VAIKTSLSAPSLSEARVFSLAIAGDKAATSKAQAASIRTLFMAVAPIVLREKGIVAKLHAEATTLPQAAIAPRRNNESTQK